MGLRNEAVEGNQDASSLVRIEEVECDGEAAEMIRTGICQCMARALHQETDKATGAMPKTLVE
jgi:hypothetical protein